MSEENYWAAKCFSETLLPIQMKNKTKQTIVKMNIAVYLDLSILEISKTLMHNVWYDSIKSKYQYNAGVCCMDTDSYIIHIKWRHWKWC